GRTFPRCVKREVGALAALDPALEGLLPVRSIADINAVIDRGRRPLAMIWAALIGPLPGGAFPRAACMSSAGSKRIRYLNTHLWPFLSTPVDTVSLTTEASRAGPGGRLCSSTVPAGRRPPVALEARAHP